MQVLRVSGSSGCVRVTPALLPYRDTKEPGPSDAIPAASFWLARLGENDHYDPHRYGNHLAVVLSGAITVTADDGDAVHLLPGDVLCCDVQSADAVRFTWRADAWILLISTPGWIPQEGALQVTPVGEPRPGRPAMTWIYDDANCSRTEPFRWPYRLTTIPAVSEWPASVGAFVKCRDHGLDGFAAGTWHNVPRRQFAITLNGCAQLETSDGTVSSPVAGDLVLIEDMTGPGHITHGRGDRWMLFLTVAPGALPMVAER